MMFFGVAGETKRNDISPMFMFIPRKMMVVFSFIFMAFVANFRVYLWQFPAPNCPKDTMMGFMSKGICHFLPSLVFFSFFGFIIFSTGLSHHFFSLFTCPIFSLGFHYNLPSIFCMEKSSQPFIGAIFTRLPISRFFTNVFGKESQFFKFIAFRAHYHKRYYTNYNPIYQT